MSPPPNCVKYKFIFGSSPSKVFLGKCVLEICSKFTEEHSCRSVIAVKLLCNFIEIALWHGCSPVNLQQISRTPLPKNTSEGLLRYILQKQPSTDVLKKTCSENMQLIYRRTPMSMCDFNKIAKELY